MGMAAEVIKVEMMFIITQDDNDVPHIFDNNTLISRILYCLSHIFNKFDSRESSLSRYSDNVRMVLLMTLIHRNVKSPPPDKMIW